MSCVTPIEDCKHVPDKLPQFPVNIRGLGCKECGVKGENWMCLTCGIILCGRYRNAHMVQHYEKFKHSLVCSFSDLSFWCYSDSSYVLDKKLSDLYTHLHNDKFGYKPPKTIEEGLNQEEKVRKLMTKIDTTEYYDDKEELLKKIKLVAELMKNSKHTTVFTGAGISTSAEIPDYRGPKGIWTLKEQGTGLETLKKVDLEKTNPTYAHMVISDFVKDGIVQFIVSTNVDGLHLKSGIPLEKISELHGNVFKDKCVKCHTQFYREFDTTKTVMKELDEKDRKNHYTQKQCEECKGDLIDTIIHFTEPLDEIEIQKAILHGSKADVCLILGTSMRVAPANQFPFVGKAKCVLVNLQKTPFDKKCLKVHCKIDVFVKLLIKEMGYETKFDKKK